VRSFLNVYPLTVFDVLNGSSLKLVGLAAVCYFMGSIDLIRNRVIEILRVLIVFPCFLVTGCEEIEPDITYDQFLSVVRGSQAENSVDCGQAVRPVRELDVTHEQYWEEQAELDRIFEQEEIVVNKCLESVFHSGMRGHALYLQGSVHGNITMGGNRVLRLSWTGRVPSTADQGEAEYTIVEDCITPTPSFTGNGWIGSFDCDGYEYIFIREIPTT